MTPQKFQKMVWDYYRTHGRDLPWRHHINPYRVAVSEIMLQQTQVSRVIPKYAIFLKTFPDWQTLARAPFRKVLSVWQGLGYNRRALALHTIAKIITTKYNGQFPKTAEALQQLPHIGPNTAASILAFAFNEPTVFIETNIRTVFIHYFFQATKQKINDEKITSLVAKTLDKAHPREWYYALMDLGSHIKQQHGNPNIKSVHYKKQSPFKGSNRELRSLILKTIAEKPQTARQITALLKKDSHIIIQNLQTLAKEGLIVLKSRDAYYIA